MKIEFEFDWVHEQKHWTHWTLDGFGQHFGGVMPPGINHMSQWTAYFEPDRATPMRHFDTAEEAKEWVVDQLHKWCERKKFATFTMPLKTDGTRELKSPVK